ncbi:MAG: hypothetical protein HQ515_13890, partial [Phycisphaeraceae bacterium]|nr:hypothetical protein [Phycisphaeraceae bacterium]
MKTKTNHKMNTLVKTFLWLQMAAILLTTAISGPVAAAIVAPFEGVVQGIEDFNPVFDPALPGGSDPVGLNILGSGSGIATNMGRFTVTWDFDVMFGVDPSPG